MKKRVLSLFLAVLMFATAFSVSAMPVAAESYYGSCGENVTWSFNTETGVLTISGKGKMADYDIGALAPWYNMSIKSVIIADGVTSIGSWAFYGCGVLIPITITIPNSVTSIGEHAFSSCALNYNSYDNAYYIGNDINPYLVLVKKKDQDITSCIINNNTKLICDNAFTWCKLTSIVIPDYVTSIGTDAFNSCVELQSLTIGKNLTSIGGHAFSGCIQLTSVTISNSVTSIGEYAFYNCSGLQSVTIGNSVTRIARKAFYGCTGIKSVTIPGSVTYIESDAFEYCSGLESITVESENAVYRSENNCLIKKSTNALVFGCKNSVIPEGVTSIGDWAFYGCTGLTSVTIPDSVTSIGDDAFYDCTGLTSVTIGSGVTSISYSAFSGCTKLETIYYTGSKDDWGKISIVSNAIPENVNIVYDYSTCEHEYDNNCDTTCNLCGKTREITHDYADTWSSDGTNHWHECSVCHIKKDISTHSFDNACDTTCNTCGYTREITHNYADTWSSDGTNHWHECSVCHIKKDISTHSFDNACDATCNTCGYTREITHNYADTWSSDGTNHWHECSVCHGKKNVAAHNFDNACDTTCNTCGYTREITHNYADTWSYNGTNHWHECSVCQEKTDITEHTFVNNTCTVCGCIAGKCSENVTWILDAESGVLTISGEGAIWSLPQNIRSNIKSVIIADGVTIIGAWAFEGCSGLTSVTMPSSVTSIEGSAFQGCRALTSITIPNSVTTIENRAFYGCHGLTSVTIPDNVTYIGSGAFEYCSGLESITVESENAVYRSESNCLIEKSTNALIWGCKNSVIPEGVTSIGRYAFSGCTGLTSVTIPNSVTSIGYDAFYGCTGLTSVTIPNSVTSISESAFEYCSGLESITVESENAVYRSENNCLIKKSTSALIFGCKNSVIPEGVTSIGDWAFSGRTELKSVTMPNSVTSIGDYAFQSCSGLTSVTMPDSVTSIGDYAFQSCSGLTSVTIGSGVTSIGRDAFGNCDGLTSVTIGNSVTSIGDDAFYGCSELTSVTISSSVTNIRSYAFYGCTKLETIYYTGSEDDWKKISIGSNAIPENTEIVYLVLSGDCGDNASWELNTESGALEISGSGEMSAASFGDNAGKIKSVAIGNEITKISSGAFDGLNNLKEVNILGNPEFEDGAIPDGYTGVIKAFGGTNAQSYCAENGIKFEGLEEYDVAGYQKNLFEENSYRIVSQMRWAEYYDKAGYDIVATLDNGTKRKISVDIKTVYKSIAGKNEKGELKTVFTPEDDCYASAIVFTGLPEMSGDEKIIFAFTPYVYNKYSKEKIVLDTEYLVYTKDGFAKYIPEPVQQILVLSDKTSDGETVSWIKFN